MNDAAHAPLPISAITHADVLQAIAKGAGDTTQICAATGRASKNMARVLDGLADDMLIFRPALGALSLSPSGRRALAAIDFAAGDVEFDERTVMLAWNQLVPDAALNPRKTFDKVALEALARDILAAGGRPKQNLVVRPSADVYLDLPVYRIVDGWRRWQAVELLINEGDLTPDLRLPCVVEDIDDREHRLAALKSAALREDLKPLEEAEAIHEWMSAEDLSTADVAHELGKSQRLIQLRLKLRTAPDIIKAELQAGVIGPQEALERMRVAAGTTKPPAPVAAAPADPEAFAPSPRQILVMVEIADNVSVRRGDDGYGPVDYTAMSADRDFNALIKTGMVMGSIGSGGEGARLTARAALWLDAQGWDPEIDPTALFRARQACGLSHDTCRLLRDQGSYATTWLAPKAAPTAPADEGDETPDMFVGDDPEPARDRAPPAAPTAPQAPSMAALDARVVAEAQRDLIERLADWRGRVARDLEVHWNALDASALTADVFCSLAKGEVVEAIALLSALRLKAGAMGASHAISRGAAERGLTPDDSAPEPAAPEPADLETAPVETADV